MGKRAKAFEIKHAMVLETLVFETVGVPPTEIEFQYRDLKRWGYDLIAGRRDGHPSHFLAEVEDRRRAGDRYQAEGESFEVDAVLDTLPRGTRLTGSIETVDGTAWLALSLTEAEDGRPLARVPAAELLLYYLSKHGLSALVGALENVGRLTELVRARGQVGRAQPYERLPAGFRHFLREARSLERELGSGRVTMAYFGENKDRKRRYRVSWVVPTLALFELNRAEKMDQILDALN